MVDTTLGVQANKYKIPCSQLQNFSWVSTFTHDPYFDVDGDGFNILPPDGIDVACGPF